MNENKIEPLVWYSHEGVTTKKTITDTYWQWNEVSEREKNPNKHYRYNLLGYTELILHISYPVYHPYKNGQFQPVEKDKERSIVKFVVVVFGKFNKRIVTFIVSKALVSL